MQAELGVLAGCMAPLARAEEARFDAEHERVRTEIEKLTGVEEAKPDWALVERLGTALLETRCKDLTIAAFVAAARLERGHWQGLREGCLLLTGFMSTFAGELFPQRARARRNALSWWVEYCAVRIPALAPGDADTLAGVRDAVQRAHAVASELLATECPAFGQLSSALDRAALAIPVVADLPAKVESQSPVGSAPPPPAAPAPPPSTVPASPPSTEPASPQAMVAPAIPELPVDERGTGAYLRFHGARLIELARARLSADSRDARSYRWLRTGLWLGWERAPDENAQGRTALPPALLSSRGELDRARSEARWEDLLRLSEALLVTMPCWLDLNFMSASALRELSAEPARLVVERETRALLARLPELTARKFRDGTPFASSETVGWLQPARTVALEAEPPPSTGDERADTLLRSLHAVPCAREQFRLRCQLASTFVVGGAHERAKSLYRGLLRDVDAFALEQWEPALALEVLQPLCALIDAQTPGGVKDADAQDLYARFARLAPWLVSKSEHGPSA